MMPKIHPWIVNLKRFALLLLAGVALHIECNASLVGGPNLSFHIVDGAGNPIAGARIIMRKFGGVCTTDSAGRCSLSNPVPYGDIDLVAAGFESIVNGRASPNKDGVVFLKLNPKPERKKEGDQDEQSEELERKREISALEKDYFSALTKKQLRSAPSLAICAALGSLLRGENTIKPERYFEGIDTKSIEREAANRKLTINKKQASRGIVMIGMSECTLVASYGYPDDINRSVGAWGHKEQYVYKALGTYVYITNGKVTSWQD